MKYLLVSLLFLSIIFSSAQNLSLDLFIVSKCLSCHHDFFCVDEI